MVWPDEALDEEVQAARWPVPFPCHDLDRLDQLYDGDDPPF